MSSPSKILILNLSRPGSTAASVPSPRYLNALVKLLRMLGFKLATVSQALAAPPYGRYACLTFDAADKDVQRHAFPKLRALGVPATVFVNTRGRGNSQWKGLQQLQLAGWEVGSLGHELEDLTAHSVSDQRRLIGRSRALLAAHLGAPPKVLAYPFGAYDATTVSVAKEEGFVAAVTLRRGLNPPGAGDAYQLARVPLAGHLLKDLWAVTRIAQQPAPMPAAEPETDAAGFRVPPKAPVELP